MASITQDMRYRLSLIRFAEKHGVSKAAIKYKTNRQYIYRWKRRYDGTIESLRDRSRRPHYHPNQHTPEEIKLIQDMRRRNPHVGLVVFWVKLMQRGYKRSIPGLYRFLKKQGIMAQKLPNPKYIPKPYEQMEYPGQRIQIDVKFVPTCCLVNDAKGKKFYQYTAIDEYSRWRYVEAFEEHSTYSSAQFLKHLIQRFPMPIECVQTDTCCLVNDAKGKKFYQYTAIDEYSRWRYVEAFEKHSTYSSAQFLKHLIQRFPMPIECVQTDNGMEFTKRFSTSGKETLTLFQRTLKGLGIQHKLIRPFTPRHNGKVERSHRKDNERFYASHTFYSFEDFSKQLQTYNRREYNQFPMRPLGWKSPQTVLREFIEQGVTYV
ncbi:DDE-type integrase/transposase/recombinase [Mediterraneibacter massiliensis]|uniref:DDE-type integrase/transposase/recombinase n=1 Tax=Mediterraneibacter massiliensis TaxID=1720300 RepID=UPI0022E60CCF|nr:DDE-type integrase/transposase/recombinase [Mediterraneibacter massiliensis]